MATLDPPSTRLPSSDARAARLETRAWCTQVAHLASQECSSNNYQSSSSCSMRCLARTGCTASSSSLSSSALADWARASGRAKSARAGGREKGRQGKAHLEERVEVLLLALRVRQAVLLDLRLGPARVVGQELLQARLEQRAEGRTLERVLTFLTGAGAVDTARCGRVSARRCHRAPGAPWASPRP